MLITGSRVKLFEGIISLVVCLITGVKVILDTLAPRNVVRHRVSDRARRELRCPEFGEYNVSSHRCNNSNWIAEHLGTMSKRNGGTARTVQGIT